MGVSYERRIYKNYLIGIAYSFWKPIDKYTKAHRLEYTGPNDFDTSRGSIVSRRGYRMADLNAIYSFNLHKQKHLLKAGLGLSYFWGLNECIQRFYWVYEHGWVYDSYFEKKGYLGVVPQLTYDYNFLKNRVNAGIDIKARFYRGVPRTQYDAGIHLGVNF